MKKRVSKKFRLSSLIDSAREKSPFPPGFEAYMDRMTRPMMRAWLAGQIAATSMANCDQGRERNVARFAVVCADILLEELEK